MFTRRKKLNKKEQKAFIRTNSKIIKSFSDSPVVGIDLGTQKTGFYSESLGSFVIEGGKKNSVIHRISVIKTKIQELMDEHASRPLVYIEDYAWGPKNASISQLAELAGNVKLLLYESGIYYICVAPSTLKKFVLGPDRGKLTGDPKALTMVEVLSRWGIKFSDDNACDGYCLYRFGKSLIAYVKDPLTKKKWEAEMFDDLLTYRVQSLD
jgi:Holliday junction resolvasome RuvABC endonuclease subunit